MALRVISKSVALVALAFVLSLSLGSSDKHLADAYEMVSTGKSIFGEGRQVKVNVPLFFNMEMNTRGKDKGVKLDESILGGFVKVSLDRLNENGKNRGPIKVSVGGITMYDNGEPPIAA